MLRFVFSLLAVLAATLFAAFCHGADNGVIVQERVINLPTDQGKWYLSVVGDPRDPRFLEVSSWFDTNIHLVNLKNSTHFNSVTTGSAIYDERYAPNTPALPMVRLQNSEGIVYSQICGSDLPASAEALNGMIVSEVRAGPVTDSIFPLLPWRRNHNCPTPKPEPKVEPVLPQPVAPPLDNKSEPVLEDDGLAPTWLLFFVCLTGFVAGSVYSVVTMTKKNFKTT
jgi:hypothetical protein